MKNIWLLILLLVFPAQVYAARSTGVTDSKTWITVDSITWTMDAVYTVGQYVNLDYYVVCPSGCSVTAISPTPTNKIGTMKNPQPGDTQGIFQADPPNDTLYVYYSSAMNVGLSLPISLVAGDNIISTTAHTWDVGDQTVIDQAAILNVVSSAPAANSFRPGYADTTVKGWTEADIDYDVFADLAHVTGQPTMSTKADRFIRLWLDFCTVVQTNRIIRPYANQQDYPADATVEVGEGAMLLNMNYSDADKRTLAIGMIQIGIDTYALIQKGMEWAADGGQSGGRKAPILIAGAALHEQDFLDIGLKSGEYGIGTFSETPADYINFGEDDQINYITQDHIDCSADPGCFDPHYNDVVGNGDEPYTQAMLGMPEYGYRMIYFPEQSEASWTSHYRSLNNRTYVGEILAALVMGLKNDWNNDAIFDYIDRYMAVSRGNADPCGYTVPDEQTDLLPPTWVVNAYDTHRTTYGELCQGSAGPPPSAGQSRGTFLIGQ